MDADEFVARMVAAGIPDMQFLPEEHSNVAPPAQLPSMSPENQAIKHHLSVRHLLDLQIK